MLCGIVVFSDAPTVPSLIEDFLQYFLVSRLLCSTLTERETEWQKGPPVDQGYMSVGYLSVSSIILTDSH